MEENAQKYVAKWDTSVVVDVYRDGDFRIVVQQNGTFHLFTDTTLACFFWRCRKLDSEVEPDGAKTDGRDA